MKNEGSNRKAIVVAAVVVFCAAVFILIMKFVETPETREKNTLDELGRIYGVYADPKAANRIYLATYGGIVSAGVDGMVKPVSSIDAEFVSFAFQPNRPEQILAGGADKNGKSIGLMRSKDGGVNWEKSDGIGIYYDLEISRASAGLVYGLTEKGISMSKDGGRTWTHFGALPGKVFDIALSPSKEGTLYAAGMKGLLISRDGGSTWEKTHEGDKPASAVHVSGDGSVYAFIVGVGLVKAEEPSLSWTTKATDFQGRVFMRIAGLEGKPGILYAISDTSIILYSRDDGASWKSFEGNNWNSVQRIESGKNSYNEYCVKCHGVEGRGEPLENSAGTDLSPAPPLNDTAHAWHHSNQGLLKTILDGSSQENSRMVAWKDTLSTTDAENVLAYIKSLWSFRSIACQGSRHMSCMHR